MDNFIGIFDNFLTHNECQDFIEYFEYLKKLNLVYNRQTLKDGLHHYKSDETAFLMEPELMIRMDNPIVGNFINSFWKKYELYTEKYSILREAQPHGILSIRMQKTLPGEGYHKWHQEASSRETSSRNIVFIAYLNDVEQGGETEFLYLHKRVQPKEGRLLIWPTGFTHTHRGNPPLVGKKYILTGWLEYLG